MSGYGCVEEGCDPWELAVRPQFHDLVEKCSSNVDEMVWMAFEKKLLSPYEKDELQVAMGRMKKTDMLLSGLMTGGADTFSTFIEILKRLGERKPMFTKMAEDLERRAVGR